MYEQIESDPSLRAFLLDHVSFSGVAVLMLALLFAPFCEVRDFDSYIYFPPIDAFMTSIVVPNTLTTNVATKNGIIKPSSFRMTLNLCTFGW